MDHHHHHQSHIVLPNAADHAGAVTANSDSICHNSGNASTTTAANHSDTAGAAEIAQNIDNTLPETLINQIQALNEPIEQSQLGGLQAISDFNASFDRNQYGKRSANAAQLDDSQSPLSKRHLSPHVAQHLDHSAVQYHEQVHVSSVDHATDALVITDHIGNDGDDGDYEDGLVDASPPKPNEIYQSIYYPNVPQNNWSGTNMVMDDSTAALWSASHLMRVRSLPVIDNLSTQILLTLGKGPYQETLNIVTCPDSEAGQTYTLLKALFDLSKKMYTNEAFLNADELKFHDSSERAVVRKINLATFVSSVFGSQEVGFFHLNECFLDTFVPEGGRLRKSQGALFLDLKTQAYISALNTGERDKEDILNDLFSQNLYETFLERRPGSKTLAPSEEEFCQKAHMRRQRLQNMTDEELTNIYVWQSFLQDVSSYVAKNIDNILREPVKKKGGRSRVSNPSTRQQPVAQQPRQPQILEEQPTPQFEQPDANSNLQIHDSQDAKTAALLSAYNQRQSGATTSPNSPPQTQEVSEIEPQGLFQSPEPQSQYSTSSPNMGVPPLPPANVQQTTPTAVLYERARLAAQSKNSANSRRSGLPSQRRPWTQEEEAALMAGLDRVKGPHWSQILGMFGAGGSINEVLKDRNQVQLKDKARNLKLFFLKSGIEVPYYLQFVTGELKTRSPSTLKKMNKAQQQQQQQQAEQLLQGTAQFRHDANQILGELPKPDDSEVSQHMYNDELGQMGQMMSTQPDDTGELDENASSDSSGINCQMHQQNQYYGQAGGEQAGEQSDVASQLRQVLLHLQQEEETSQEVATSSRQHIPVQVDGTE